MINVLVSLIIVLDIWNTIQYTLGDYGYVDRYILIVLTILHCFLTILTLLSAKVYIEARRNKKNVDSQFRNVCLFGILAFVISIYLFIR